MQHFLQMDEVELVRALEKGFTEVLIAKTGLYPSCVAFRLPDSSFVRLCAKAIDVGPMTEIFPLKVTSELKVFEPDARFRVSDCKFPASLSVLRKTEYEMDASSEEFDGSVGNSTARKYQFEGAPDEMSGPAAQIATLDAGISIEFKDGSSLKIATSMFPFALYVTECAFSEQMDLRTYEQIPI